MTEKYEKKRKEVKKVSRRGFLKGSAGYIIGGAASLGIGGLALTGCRTGSGCVVSGKADTTRTSAQVDTEYVGECVCPDCDTRIPHPRGVPCRMISCPKCDTAMGRGAV